MDFFYFRGELTLRTTFIWIGGMILFACAESAPLFFMAQISPLVSFQAEVQMQNILICREVWTKGSRVAYKTFSCVFQFIIPLCFVVSISLCHSSLETLAGLMSAFCQEGLDVIKLRNMYYVVKYLNQMNSKNV